MARPHKLGIQYFPFDVDFFSDKKIKILKARYGVDGITIYLYILCEVYRNGYYIQMDDDYEYIIADDLGMSSDKVKQVLMFLLERSLLDSTLFQSDAIITSQGIQRRFQEAVQKRGEKCDIEVLENVWLLPEKETKPFIKVTKNPSYSEKNPSYSEKNPSYSAEKPTKVNKSKSKESKGNKNKENSGTKVPIAAFPDTGDEELNQALSDFQKMRKQIKKPLTERAINSLLSKLEKLAGTKGGKINGEKAVRILEQSIINDWQDIYPLKDESQKNEQRSRLDELREA